MSERITRTNNSDTERDHFVAYFCPFFNHMWLEKKGRIMKARKKKKARGLLIYRKNKQEEGFYKERI